jgi:hypothetical protein
MAAAFAAASLRDSLTREPPGPATGARYGVSDLHAYVNEPDYIPEPGFNDALEDDHRLRRNLEAILSRRALCAFELARVASSGTLDHRQEGPYSISVQQSRAVAGRTIVVIELGSEAGRTPRSIIAQSADGRSHKLPLPEAEDGRIQLMVNTEGAGFLAAFRDPNTRVYLQ